MGLENPNSGLDLVETFFPNSVSDLDSAETFPKSRNLGLDIDDNVCLLDSQPCVHVVADGRKILTRLGNTGQLDAVTTEDPLAHVEAEGSGGGEEDSEEEAEEVSCFGGF